jgi:hypothetical protein
VDGMILRQSTNTAFLSFKRSSGVCQLDSKRMSDPDASQAPTTPALSQLSPEDLLQEILIRCQQFDRHAWLSGKAGTASQLVEGAKSARQPTAVQPTSLQ